MWFSTGSPLIPPHVDTQVQELTDELSTLRDTCAKGKGAPGAAGAASNQAGMGSIKIEVVGSPRRHAGDEDL